MADPDIVLIGHLAHDLQPDGTARLGGSVTYAGLLAARHGLHVGIVTSATPEAITQLAALHPNFSIAAVPSATTTIFENLYHDGHRQQFLHARATAITATDVPAEWRSAPITLLCPIADEIAPEVASICTGAIRAATPQGWLRRWDATGRVQAQPWQTADAIIPHLTALVLSVEDLAIAAGASDAHAMVKGWAARIPIVALTDGPRPATVWEHGASHRVPAFHVTEVDPTGAGDCFAAAFLIALRDTRDPILAARYAHAAASFVVAASGIDGIPTANQVQARLADGH
jgi:1D-myo-inositol 3-kinase